MPSPNIYALTDTRWSNAGTTYNGIWMDFNNGSGGAAVGAAGSKPLRLSNNGSDFFYVDLTGAVIAFSNIVSLSYISSNAYIQVQSNAANSGIYLGSALDVFLTRDGAADTLALRRSTNPQQFNIYNTYTDASNYERLRIQWSANRLQFGTASSGTGANRSIDFTGIDFSFLVHGLGAVWYILSTGHIIASTDNTYDIGASGANRPKNIYAAGTISASIFQAAGYVASPNYYVNTDTGSLYFGSSQDTIITRDAANTLALRNSTNPQTFNIYNTFTDASNYERFSILATATTVELRTDKLGTGSARPLRLICAGSQLTIGTETTNNIRFETNTFGRWYIDGNTGNWYSPSDNTYDIGAAGALRPKNIYIAGDYSGTTFKVGGALWTDSINDKGNNITMFAITQPNCVFANGATSPLFQFSGTTNASPAIKRQNVGLEFRKADDSVGTWVKTAVVTLASLSASIATAVSAGNGAIAYITDASAPTFGATAAGGASTNMPVYSDGTQWRIG